MTHPDASWTIDDRALLGVLVLLMADARAIALHPSAVAAEDMDLLNRHLEALVLLLEQKAQAWQAHYGWKALPPRPEEAKDGAKVT